MKQRLEHMTYAQLFQLSVGGAAASASFTVAISELVYRSKNMDPKEAALEMQKLQKNYQEFLTKWNEVNHYMKLAKEREEFNAFLDAAPKGEEI